MTNSAKPTRPVIIRFGDYRFTNHDVEQFLETVPNTAHFDFWMSILEGLQDHDVLIDFDQNFVLQNALVFGFSATQDYGKICYCVNKIYMEKQEPRIMIPVIKNSLDQWDLDARFERWLKSSEKFKQSEQSAESETSEQSKVFYLYQDQIFEKIEVARTQSVSDFIELYQNVNTKELLIGNSMIQGEIIQLTDEQILTIAKIAQTL